MLAWYACNLVSSLLSSIADSIGVWLAGVSLVLMFFPPIYIYTVEEVKTVESTLKKIEWLNSAEKVCFFKTFLHSCITLWITG